MQMISVVVLWGTEQKNTAAGFAKIIDFCACVDLLVVSLQGA